MTEYQKNIDINKEHGFLCSCCNKPIKQPLVGRRRRFCSDECRRDWWKVNIGKGSPKAVLEAFVSICEPKAEVPEVEKGKWPYADILLGGGWSVAYRTIDAQYFGVHQRRRRIYLVADFAGTSAGEILFERQGLSRDFTPSGSPWERTTCNAEGSAKKTISFEPGAMSRFGKKPTEEMTSTLLATMGNNQACVAFTTGSFMTVNTEKTSTLAARDYKDPPCVFENHSQDTRYNGPLEKAQTVSATYGMGGNSQPFVVSENDTTVYGICSDGSNSMKSDNPASGIYEADTSRTIDANGGNPS